jgi:predicted MFS family arabinose efflux permease
MACGIRYVFSKPLLRACLAMIWSSSLFVYAFEGQVAALVKQIGAGPRLAGLLLAAAPAGVALGSFAVTRLVAPARRVRLVLPLAMAACGVQIVMLAEPPAVVCIAVFFVVGVAAVYSTVLNPIFVKAVDAAYRGRAMGVAVAGINLAQGTAAVTAGLFARTLGAAHTIGFYGLAGAAMTLLAGLTSWRHRER